MSTTAVTPQLPPSGPPPGVSFVPMPGAAQTPPAATPPPAAPQAQGPPPGVSLVPMPGAAPATLPGDTTPTADTSTAPTSSYASSLWDRAKDALTQLHDAVGEGQKGVIKGVMQDVGGALQIGANKVTEHPDYITRLAYKHAHPEANDAQVEAAVNGTNGQKPYRDSMTEYEHHALQTAADWINKHAQTHGIFQQGGAMGESVAEFLGPEALEKIGMTRAASATELPGTVEKLQSSLKAAKILQEHPVIAKLVAIGARALKAGGEAGAQTYLKTGGNADQAQDSAAMAAAGGAVLEGGSEALKAGIKHISPTVENLGGVEIPRLASQNAYASSAQELAATAERAPKIQRAQQEAGKEIISNAAKGAAEQHLGELNEGRNVADREATVARQPYKFRIRGTGATETSEGNIAQQPRKQQIGTRVLEGKGPSERQVFTEPGTGDTAQVDVRPNGDQPGEVGSHRAPTYRLSEESKPGSVVKHDIVSGGADIATEDPNVAKSNIAALNEAIDSPDITPQRRGELIEQRSDMQRQMSEYHASRAGQEYSPYHDQPTFEHVDIPKAVARVGSYGDAADELEGAAKPVYNRLDDLTGGRFTRLREENKRAWNAVTTGGGEAAQTRLEQSQRDMDAMLSGHDREIGDSVSQTDLSYANEAWKKAQTLRDIHAKVESTFDTAVGASDRANAYRGFNGNRLRGALKQLSDKYGERPLTRMIGADQYNNLVKLADITRTSADRQKFGGGVHQIAKYMVQHEGAMAAKVAGAGGTAGYLIAGPHGAAVGAAATEATYLATRRVMRAIATNPKVGKNFAFALEAGARPEVYAPMIAAAIRENEKPNQ